ncbi:D-ala-D-ala dipeptidase [Candidatus Kryptobacter tengchongensis]|uniref:D-ala-D-ala dipeptidase n=1 Tax=Kryptobacter tengchongensis TaxID=1643429 RepID=A0A656D9U0_KRYT1|nr:M15 family metallopeptidase [Candidatus Kryptobacter tengchongensis]CUT02529.1 D-ala-D-ala dipeptidase [Candidatus Kryptobacter tengchongensis]
MKVKFSLLLIFSLLLTKNLLAQFSHEDTILVDIQKINPRIKIDIKYATEDNFTGRKLYSVPKCFLRRFVALKLDSVQKELEKNRTWVKGLGLLPSSFSSGNFMVYCP